MKTFLVDLFEYEGYSEENIKDVLSVKNLEKLESITLALEMTEWKLVDHNDIKKFNGLCYSNTEVHLRVTVISQTLQIHIIPYKYGGNVIIYVFDQSEQDLFFKKLVNLL